MFAWPVVRFAKTGQSLAELHGPYIMNAFTTILRCLRCFPIGTKPGRIYYRTLQQRAPCMVVVVAGITVFHASPPTQCLHSITRATGEIYPSEPGCSCAIFEQK